MSQVAGGYDDGYQAVPCLWGTSPGSLIIKLEDFVGSFRDRTVLDLGCGEGKNAAYFCRSGARVEAVDLSETAIANGRAIWPEDFARMRIFSGDALTASFSRAKFDIVVLYGLLHCLPSEDSVVRQIERAKSLVADGGYIVACTFNARHQDLSAHPGFSPCLLTHSFYLEQFASLDLLYQSDEDLHEIHPHNGIPHTHSMTRLIARKR